MEVAGEEAHHIARVLRLRPGDDLVVFDGSGREADATIVEGDGGSSPLRVLVKEVREVNREIGVAITLAAAIPKGKRADFMIQKCAELGMRRFIPLDCARSVVHAGTRAETKIRKWQRICDEASKQCGRNRVAEIAPPTTLTDVLGQARAHRLALIADPGAAPGSLRAAVERHEGKPDSVLYLVGPEGGFTPTEITEARKAGCEAVALAPAILRTETAAIAGVAMLAYAAS